MQKPSSKSVLRALPVLLAVSMSGCAQMAVKKAIKQYEENLNPQVGKATKDSFIKRWGPPSKSSAVSDGEVCVWRFSYGTRAYASGSQYGAHARAHEVYDELLMTFDKDGVLRNWRVWCQR
ncbi:unnamed protein product [marine sediment metagenome]|uniref:Lipoprotein n=1 Tax=marine sediment metagenome TaxID=412755 RepID=X0SRG1_9ZZZZ